MLVTEAPGGLQLTTAQSLLESWGQVRFYGLMCLQNHAFWLSRAPFLPFFLSRLAA